MKETIKRYAVFSLDSAVEGISNYGIERSTHSFVATIRTDCIFKTEQECEAAIEEIMVDYTNRKVEPGTRFTILPIYFPKSQYKPLIKSES